MQKGKALVGATVLALSLYAVLWVSVVADWSWLVSVDTGVLRVCYDFGVRHPGWTDAWRGVSDLFSPTALRLLAGFGIVVALIRREPRVALFLVATVMLSGLVTAAAKALSDRPRPATALTHAGSSSFPSGHALGITVAVLAFGTVLWPSLSDSLRRAFAVAGGVLVVLVGVSRVVLTVHHPSDVLAGCALGLAYFVLCLWVVPPRAPELPSRG